jgi:hypothetical protein
MTPQPSWSPRPFIKLAQQGVREVDALLKAALKEFDLDK